ncbi:LysR substrate-binding domain-containing protein [Paraburkholderia dipogonis]|nr:LysR family transcriptional regulator [Paraburkholderia dipogonis]
MQNPSGRRPTLLAMRAFVLLIETENREKAATQMEITVAQVTALMRELEKRLGVQLLLRTGERYVPTEAGIDFGARCREVIALTDEAEAMCSGAAMAPRGLLRIQCDVGFGQRYVLPVIGNFCARFPQITVEFSTSSSTSDLLIRGVDASIHLADRLMDPRGLSRKLGDTFMVLCASPAYLEKHGHPRTPVDLYDQPCFRLISPSVPTDWNLIDDTGTTQRLLLRSRLTTDTPELLTEVTLQGKGIALMPTFCAIELVRAGRLQHVLREWRSQDIGVYATFSAQQPLDSKSRAWLEWVTERITPQLQTDREYFRIQSQQ